MMEPIRVCELDEGRPKYQVPKFHRIAAMSKRKHHGEAGAAAHLQNQFDRQQRDDAERDGAGRDQHAQKIERSGPNDREVGRHGIRINDGGDRIGGVVKSIDELESQRDHQGDAEQDVGIGAGVVHHR